MKYNKGDTAYLIENNCKVREVIITGSSGEFYTIRFNEEKLSAIRVKEHRLYQSEEEASMHLKKPEQQEKRIHTVPLH